MSSLTRRSPSVCDRMLISKMNRMKVLIMMMIGNTMSGDFIDTSFHPQAVAYTASQEPLGSLPPPHHLQEMMVMIMMVRCLFNWLKASRALLFIHSPLHLSIHLLSLHPFTQQFFYRSICPPLLTHPTIIFFTTFHDPSIHHLFNPHPYHPPQHSFLLFLPQKGAEGSGKKKKRTKRKKCSHNHNDSNHHQNHHQPDDHHNDDSSKQTSKRGEGGSKGFVRELCSEQAEWRLRDYIKHHPSQCTHPQQPLIPH